VNPYRALEPALVEAVKAGLRLPRATRFSERISLRETAGRREAFRGEVLAEDFDVARPFRKLRDADGFAFRRLCDPLDERALWPLPFDALWPLPFEWKRAPFPDAFAGRDPLCLL
jgi:hypothetical protein